MSVGTRWRIWVLGLLACAAAGGGVLAASAGSRAATARTGTQISTTGSLAPPTRVTAATLAKDHWQRLARSPLGRRADAVVSWDGSELLEIGGDSGGETTRVFDTAAAFEPVTGRWRAITPAPAAVDPDDAASAWTGSQLFVFGSPLGSASPSEVAGLYDPRTDQWRVTPPAPATGLTGSDSTAVWDGSQVILAGAVYSSGTAQPYVLGYSPIAGTWTRMDPPFPTGHPPQAFAMVNTDDGVLLWSEWTGACPSGTGGGSCSGVDVFRLLGGTWQQVDVAWTGNETVDEPLFTGSEVLLGGYQIWCGLACPAPLLPYTHGREVNPRTLTVTNLTGGPLSGASNAQILWSGAAEIDFNTETSVTGPRVHLQPGDIAFWDPRSRRWSSGPALKGYVATDLAAAWDGSALLALSGSGALYRYGAS